MYENNQQRLRRNYICPNLQGLRQAHSKFFILQMRRHGAGGRSHAGGLYKTLAKLFESYTGEGQIFFIQSFQ